MKDKRRELPEKCESYSDKKRKFLGQYPEILERCFERIGKNLTANARSLFPIQQGFMDAGLFKMFESGNGSRKFDKK